MKLETLIEQYTQKHKDRKILYPDNADERIKQAVSKLLENGDTPVIVGSRQELELYRDLITGKKLAYFQTPDNTSNLLHAGKLVAEGKAYGIVAGNISDTAHVIKAFYETIPVSKGIQRFSSHFLMGKDENLFLFADCGVQENPNAQQLAEIALLTAQRALGYGLETHVAFLSSSTFGSGGDKNQSLGKIREAISQFGDLCRQHDIEKNITYEPQEIQFDAAFIPDIGNKKKKTQDAKRATVYVFPDLNAGNIAYKVAERLAGYTALGPILQGFSQPVNDLSRGCSIEDIIATHHITKNS